MKLKQGDKVCHEKYGSGTITSNDEKYHHKYWVKFEEKELLLFGDKLKSERQQLPATWIGAEEKIKFKTDESMKPPKYKYEYTTTFELEFPNGERVVIPEPGEGWEMHAETKFIWPHRHIRDYGISIYPKHFAGYMILHEYHRRTWEENARVLWICNWRWKREVPRIISRPETSLEFFRRVMS